MVAGDGDDRARLEAKAAGLGISDRVVFTGFTSEATLAELYRRCAGFAMPSRGEGFGLVYLEAMRAGKPVLAARGSAAEEIVVDGRTGLLVDPDDRDELRSALVRLLDHPGEAKRMGEAGYERWRREFGVERFRGAADPPAREAGRADVRHQRHPAPRRLGARDRPRGAAPHPRCHDLPRTGRRRGLDLGRRPGGARQPAPGDPRPLGGGAQPMASEDGRFQIVINGEIYNFAELRRELEADGVRFRSRSDTEVVLALYARDGAAMLSRLRGMFALAIWDDREKSLLLARDPLGIKPLYLATEGGCLRFASQVKALEAGGAISRETDPAGVAGFLLWGSVPEPLTIRRSVRALPPGHHLIVREGRIGEPVASGRPTVDARWSRRRRSRTRCGRTWSRTCRSPSSSRRGSTPG